MSATASLRNDTLRALTVDLETATTRLAAWCRTRDFAGDDPYDGLNSRLFQSTPLNRSRIARLAWTQLFKRSPLNLRRLTGVSPARNPKGTALFALAALARWRRTQDESAKTEARNLLESLTATRITGQPVGDDGAAWGYNFDWQGRAFFAPRGTPTIVPTAFVARAFLEAWREFRDESYLDSARRACTFIVKRLPRSIETPDEICFAYSPLDRTRVFNASLLAAETLASTAVETNDAEFCDLALRAARYVVRRQKTDGRWAYGAEEYQSWADNFHTAFLLFSLLRIHACARAFGHDTSELTASLERGYEFWRGNFFDPEGAPKYYAESLFPVDAHAAGASLVTLLEIAEVDTQSHALAIRVAQWATRNMQDRHGFFYYQRHRRYTNRIPYMRWSQAWMLYGLERLLEIKNAKLKMQK